MSYSKEPNQVDVKTEIAAAVCAALGAQSASMTDPVSFALADVLALIEKPPERKLGDYAIPCFRFAAKLRKKPQEVTGNCVSYLIDHTCQWIDHAVSVGGFLNIFV